MGFRLAIAALAIGLAAAPALAESQSSNSSSNCSNGRCTRIDNLSIRDDRGRTRSWRHVEHWREDRAPRHGDHASRRDWQRPGPAWRGRDNDDDDDD